MHKININKFINLAVFNLAINGQIRQIAKFCTYLIKNQAPYYV